MKLVILPYKEKSKGAKMLAAKLRVPLHHVVEDFKPTEETLVLNWGRGDFPIWRDKVYGFINSPRAVITAINKGQACEAMFHAAVPCVPHTFHYKRALKWAQDGETVFCRQSLEGKDGEGIVIAEGPDQLQEARLYTKYIPVVKEYRIHVMGGEAFYSNVKVKGDNPKVEKVDDRIRSGTMGWFFVHMDSLPKNKKLVEAAIKAVDCLGLDFGGVDVGLTEDGNPVIFEVNTAPEMGPNTTFAYVQALKQHYGEHKNSENISLSRL